MSKTYHLFSIQRSKAKKRGIIFEFTFNEWEQWWLKNLGHDWQKLRGRKSGQYVMARRDDVGPYNSNNVDCVTVRINCSTPKKSGVHNPRAKLTLKEVTIIRTSTEKQTVLAERYGVTPPNIRAIKTGKSWSKT